MSFKRLSKIMGPIQTADPKLVNFHQITSKSMKLFSEGGLVRLNEGKVVLLPLLVRSMRKLENIIHEEMEKISAQEILLPLLVRERLLKATGRNDKLELFKLKDRTDKTYVLAPTNEEPITALLGSESQLKESSFPLRYYQINTKFRDEAQAKHGLIRSKEFRMKDLYCFDISPDARKATYDEVVQQYHNLFKRLQLPYLCVSSTGGDMLAGESLEFHFESNIGEDELIICKKCGHSVNINMVENKEKCQSCSNTDVKHVKGIEVAHAFNIGTIYSEKLNAQFHTNSGKAKFLEMSCYGIGVTRILGASVEVLSSDTNIRWPLPLAPYTVCIIVPKKGSKEDKNVGFSIDELCMNIQDQLNGDVIIDDRTKYTIGKRLLLNQKLGFPFIVVIGKDILNDLPQVEFYDMNKNEKLMIHPTDVVSIILEKMSHHCQ